MPGPDPSVADRLRRLRGQAGHQGPAAELPPAPGAAPPTFSERVRRLMIGPERAAPKVPDESELAELLGAEVLQPGVLAIDRHLEPRLKHGRAPLKAPFVSTRDLPDALMDMAVPRRDPDARSAPLVYLDTETSGLAGGSGTWAFLTGMLWAEEGAWRLRQVLLTRLDAEPAYLEAVRTLVAPDSGLVTYNGRSFDLPLLATRLRLCGQVDPFGALPHLDLLAPVRRAFGRVWPDCRLATAEQRLLGVEREGDLPGSAAPAAWLAWLRRGETSQLVAVLRHNRWDLLSLAGLVPALGEVFENPAVAEADTHAVAAHHLARGQADKALGMLRADRHRLGSAGLLELARLHRRREEWPEALIIWEALASAGELSAITALAKYHEHQTRDLARALEHAVALPSSPERERRCERLRAKLALRSARLLVRVR